MPGSFPPNANIGVGGVTVSVTDSMAHVTPGSTVLSHGTKVAVPVTPGQASFDFQGQPVEGTYMVNAGGDHLSPSCFSVFIEDFA